MDNISIKTAELFANESMNMYTSFISEMNKVISKFQGTSPTILDHIKDKIRRVNNSNMPAEFKEKLNKAYSEQRDFFSQQIGTFTRAIARAEERKATVEGVKATFSAKPVIPVKKAESVPTEIPPTVPVISVVAEVPVKAESAPVVNPPTVPVIPVVAEVPVKAESVPVMIPAVSEFLKKATSAPLPVASSDTKEKPKNYYIIKAGNMIRRITPSPRPMSVSPAVVSKSPEIPGIADGLRLITPSPVQPESVEEPPNMANILANLNDPAFQAILVSFQPLSQ